VEPPKGWTNKFSNCPETYLLPKEGVDRENSGMILGLLVGFVDGLTVARGTGL